MEKKTSIEIKSPKIKSPSKYSLFIKTNHSNKMRQTKIFRKPNKIVKENHWYNYLCNSLPLIFKNCKSKLIDHLLLGNEHTKKVSPGFSSPIKKTDYISEEDKIRIVLEDPKFGMFSLFKYHITRGYLNNELKKKNKVYCSHIFSLIFALPILVFASQWLLYISLMSREVRIFDGEICPNKANLENKLMMMGIGIIYFVRSFFIWDNLTTRISLRKTNRIDTVCAILDNFQEFLFNIIVYTANLWIIFAENDIQNMILNSLAMEFLMTLDNEFEESYILSICQE